MDASDGRRRLPRFVLLLALLLVGPASAVAAQTGGTLLNFKDAELSSVIATVSQVTGKNFVVDPRVKGRVTVISSRPIPPREVYQVFLSVLAVHGFAAVPGGGGVIRIVPSVNAKQSPIPTVSGAAPGAGNEYVTRVVKVQNVDAAQLVPLLRPLLPQQAHLGAYSPGNTIIISAAADNVDRLVTIIHRVDISSHQKIDVIPLEHASAADVVRVLQGLEKGEKGGGGATLAADTRTNSVLIGGTPAARLRMRTLVAHLDTPLSSNSGNTRVIYLRYANAKDLLPIVSGLIKTLGAAAGKKNESDIGVQADEATNALVLNAPPDVMRSIESVVRRLDIRRAQVLVEAVIAEVSSDKANQLGVQWVYDASKKNAPVGIVNFSAAGSGLQNLLQSPPVVGDGLSLALGDTAGNGAARFAALIRALASDAETNILSTPTLVTLDNHEAQIVVGENVPFVTGSYVNTGGGTTPSNPFQTIERKDVGLTLKVKPQINEGNTIRLNISQEVSSIASAVTGAADLVTKKRAIKTTVLVDDGQTVVLGGLDEDQVQENEQRVPGLGDIPILGNLFSYKTASKVKTNLMIFIRPKILRQPGQNILATGEKYQSMRAEQLRMRQRGIFLMPGAKTPVLPPLPAQGRRLPQPFGENHRLPRP